MADNSKTYDRRVNIWINGKEVENNISSIKKEMFQLTNELARTIRGTKEYNEKAAELRKIKAILNEHQENVRATGGAWETVKKFFAGAQGVIMSGVAAILGAYQSIKGVVASTEGVSDKFNNILAAGKEVFWELQNSIATLDFSNLLTNLREAWERGKKLNEELDRLADERAYSDYLISSLSRESRELQEIIKNVNLEISVRSDAAERRREIEEKIYNRSIVLARRVFDIEKDSWSGRNKIAAEEAIKLYEIIDGLSTDMEKRLEQAFSYQTGLFGKKQGVEMIRSGEAMRGALKGIPEDVIQSYADYFNLLEQGEEDVLPKLFNAFKNFENATEEAQIRLNSAVKESSTIFKKETASQAEMIKTQVEDLQSIIESAKYNPEDYYNNEDLDAWVEAQIKANDDVEKDYKESREAIYFMIAEQADKALQKIKEDSEEEKKILNDKIDRYLQFAGDMGKILGASAFDSKKTAKETIKDLIKMSIDALHDIVWLAIGETTIRNLAKSGWKGLIEAGLITAGIEAAFETAKSAVTSMYDEGGYTPTGTKHTPVGVVHAGEWVANARMVADPATGPIIRMLDDYQFKNGRGFASGGMTSGSSQSSSPALPVDPGLQNTLLRLERLLTKLDRDGVKNNWTYSDVDKLRQGITRIEDIEDNVSL